MSKPLSIEWLGDVDSNRFIIPGVGSMEAPRRTGLIRLIAPDATLSAALLGRVNREPIQFTNLVALPETLLLIGTPNLNDPPSVRLCHLLTRGVCEDGVTRFVGWNRIWRPQTQRWERCGPVAPSEFTADGVKVEGAGIVWGNSIYAHAEEVDPRGLAALWEIA